MKTRREMRLKRKLRIRAKIFGTAKRPRFAVFRSNRSLAVQLIDDEKRITLIAKSGKGKSMQTAKELGLEIATAAKNQKISEAVFDRSGYQFHGVIKAIADAAREGGLKF